MRMWRKFTAVALALVIVLAFSAVASADTIGDSGKVGSTSADLTNSNEVVFNNVLTVKNPDEESIYAPDVTYSFEIVAATTPADGVGTTVTASGNVVASVLSGSNGTITIGEGAEAETINYTVTGSPKITNPAPYSSANEIPASQSGTDDTQAVTVSFEGVTFSKSGIYRYKITRTVTSNNAGFTPDNNNVRYLDVYVKEASGNTSIYGYVLHTSATDIASGTSKSAGYNDTYATSNLIVNKTLVNDNAMVNHQFPFSVSFTGVEDAHIKTTATVSGYTGTGSATVAAMDANATTSSPKIAHGSAVKYIGIPNGFTATVTETNDVTGTAYTSEANADTVAVAKVISGGVTSNEAASTAATNTTKIIAFTNTLALISPTGVTLRYAPYLAMMGVGIVALPLSIRRKKEDF